MNFEELRNIPHWVIHRFTTPEADQTMKLPLNPNTGEWASTDDPRTWSDYATALACTQSNTTFGLGFVLTKELGISCLDLDSHKVKESSLLQEHGAIADYFDSYMELSPSGGVHVWMRGTTQNRKLSQKQIEIYSYGRYMTVTGKALNTREIEDRHTKLVEAFPPDAVEAPVPQVIPTSNGRSDKEVCYVAANASNGERFKKLWEGNWQQEYASQSEADLAFINIVAYYTDDKEQVARIYYGSQLFLKSPKRQRKARRDYLFDPGYGLIHKAFDQKFPSLDFTQLSKQFHTMIENNMKEDLQTILKEQPIEMRQSLAALGFPPGIVGEIANFIYNNALWPIKEVAIAGAIAYFAGIVGKGYNISHTGLNQYVALLGSTGKGKEAAASGMERITTACKEVFEHYEQFVGPSDIKSPEALIRQLATVSPCFLTHKGEFGLWLQKITAPYAKSNEMVLRGLLMDLYTKSGGESRIRGSAYADKSKDIPTVDAPAFSLFGDATQESFYKAIDEITLDEGLVSRFTVIECSNSLAEHNENHGAIPVPPELVTKLVGIAKRCLALRQLGTPVHVLETPDAKAFEKQYMIDHYQQGQEEDSVESKLARRKHLKLIRLAALIAVGCNPDVPTINMDHLKWSQELIEVSNKCVLDRFRAGKVGLDQGVAEQYAVLETTIRQYMRGGYKKDYYDTYFVSDTMYNMSIITHRYLHQKVGKGISFRKDRIPGQAFKNAIQMFVDNGLLIKVDMGKVKDSGRSGLAYFVVDRLVRV